MAQPLVVQQMALLVVLVVVVVRLGLVVRVIHQHLLRLLIQMLRKEVVGEAELQRLSLGNLVTQEVEEVALVEQVVMGQNRQQ
jgi:phosphopantetheine adenylyltransferase